MDSDVNGFGSEFYVFLLYKRGEKVVIESGNRLKEELDAMVKLRESGLEREQKLRHELQSYKLDHK